MLVSQAARRCLDLEGKNFLTRERFTLVLAVAQKHDAMRTLAQLLLDNGRDIVQINLGALFLESRDLLATTIDDCRTSPTNVAGQALADG